MVYIGGTKLVIMAYDLAVTYNIKNNKKILQMQNLQNTFAIFVEFLNFF